MTSERLQIAVVGGGVAGIVSAYLLAQRHDVTLLEMNDYLGGHTNTIVVKDGPDAGLAVDTGFIVLNDRTYPNFHRFLSRLEVPVRFADMSFGYVDEGSGLQYSGRGFGGLFAQPVNALSKQYLGMLSEILRFNRQARRDLQEQGLESLTLREYIERNRYSDYMVRHYLLPMGAAIWSSPDQGIFDFPADTYIRFFDNHGLLSLWNRPRWQTVVGGSHQYVKKFLEVFPGTVSRRSEVETVIRREKSVELQFADGTVRRFDSVVICTHADQALRLLGDPDPEERRLLGAWSYQPNTVVLHTDSSVLPSARRAWASWNYSRESGLEVEHPVSVTYHMNRLQGFHSEREYCVTLNRSSPIDDTKVLQVIEYTHPVYTTAAVRSQAGIRQLNGRHETFYAGSYLGYGFHEDAVLSAVEVGGAFGIEL